jgi:crotonobetainyl-CoA:carnitine CoA-transferase CaiB-like acyl-CoA transferase
MAGRTPNLDRPSAEGVRVYQMTRREFISTTGTGTMGIALASSLPSVTRAAGAATTGTPAPDFDINRAFEQFMMDLGGSATDGGGKVTFTGKDPIVHSYFRIGASMAIPAMAAAVGAAAIYKDRTGTGQDASVDLRESMMNVNPLITVIMKKRQLFGLIPANDPVANGFTFIPTAGGRWYQAPLAAGNPFSWAIFELKDGKYVTISGVYPQLLDRALTLLAVPPDRQKIASVLKTWDSKDLDEAMGKYNVVGGIHRTSEEWLAHPQGAYLSKVPVIEIVKVGDTKPLPFSKNPEQPLSDVKVLSLTHVIAGSCAARTLAEYGAEVLHVARDQSFEHEGLITDLNVGMRSTWLDLKKQPDKDSLYALLPKADVFIESFRGRAIERLGFGVEEVAKRRPGIIYLSVRAYGWDGPWVERSGFDMEGLTVTGFTMGEGGGRPAFSETYSPPDNSESGRPAFPPTMVMNDYVAGYLGAAGIIAALRRRASEGGSYHVRVSLARAAMWFQSLGKFKTNEVDTTNPDHKMIPIESITGASPYGEIRRLPPQVKLSKTPGRWRAPLVSVRGGSKAAWHD